MSPLSHHGVGKLILCGEHAVVHGSPAIAVPIQLRTTVTITPCKGPNQIEHEIESPRDEERLEAAIATVFPDGGRIIRIESNIPVGVGMGSSAALSVAIARSLDLDPIRTREVAMDMERVFHGDPSGLDVAVSLREEAVWFVRGQPMRVVPRPPCSIVVVDSGTAGNTRQLVESVAARKDDLEEVLDDIRALVHAARAVLQDPQSLGELLTENHGLLRKLGVSTPELDLLVDLCLATGAYGAKLSGAGGGGVVMALTDDPDRIVRSATTAGFDAWIAIGAP